MGTLAVRASFLLPGGVLSRTAIGNGNGQLRAGATMTHTLIYPSNSAHSSEGHLEIDGCDVVELAERFGTPLMVYEEKTIRDQCRRFQEGFSRLTQDFEVIYAGKALCTLAICALVVEEGLSLDVSSGGEYYTALQAGVPTDRIFFHGNNKTQAELEYVLDNGGGCVVVDNLYEMELLERVGLPVPRILVEPGRSIVGKAGVTAYTVGSMKDIPGIRTYVSVDGGMSDNMRPMLYGAKYEAMLGNKAEALTDTTVTVAGKHCESGDILIKDAVIAAPEVGDILVTPATGGYCYSMASNYNGSLRPCVLLVRDGEALGSWLSASLMTI